MERSVPGRTLHTGRKLIRLGCSEHRQICGSRQLPDDLLGIQFGAARGSFQLRIRARGNHTQAVAPAQAVELRHKLVCELRPCVRGQHVGEILGYVQLPVAFSEGNSDGIGLRVKDVGAVRRRVHQAIMQPGHVGRISHVFGDEIEVCPSSTGPLRQGRFPGELV